MKNKIIELLTHLIFWRREIPHCGFELVSTKQPDEEMKYEIIPLDILYERDESGYWTSDFSRTKDEVEIIYMALV